MGMTEAGKIDGQSFEYRLQHLPVGVVVLDGDRRVLSANGPAQKLLGSAESAMFGVDILVLHPPAVREKVGWLIANAKAAADGAASMIVATRMGNLLARVTALRGGPGLLDDGYCMMFFVLGALGAAAAPDEEAGARFLLKLPIQKGAGDVISLVDVATVVALSAQGHYAEARTLDFTAFCPRSLAAMEARLDPALFVRVHREHMVAIRHIRAAERIDGRWFLRMSDEAATLIPVGRQKVGLVRRLLAV
jgi:hypothetical protein